MHQIVDRSVLLLACAALSFFVPDSASAVAAMLAGVTLSAVCGYVKGSLALWMGLGAYVGCSVFWPDLSLYVPLVSYSAFVLFFTTRKHHWLIPPTLGLFLPWALLPSRLAFSVISVTGLAFILAMRTTELGRVDEEARRIVDESREMAILLQEKNLELGRNQDLAVRAATLGERGRIAREIHDHVGHLLSRSILQVGALIASEPGAREGLLGVRGTLRQAMDSIRTSVHNLHDDSVDLVTQLGALVDGFQFCPIRYSFDIEREPERDLVQCFVAVAKEGLSNIIRHSDATQVSLSLTEHPALYQLVLQDNGTGGTRGNGEGLGMKSIRERVQSLGGRVFVGKEGGFRLFVSVPKGGVHRASAGS